MFFRIIICLLLSFYLSANVYAESDIDNKFNALLSSLRSTITIENGVIKTDIKPISNGMKFEVFRLKGEIKHPITGESLGKQRVKVGEADVEDNKLTFKSSEPLLSGDEIVVKLPLSIETDFKSLNTNQVYEIVFEINKNGGIVIEKNSENKFTCHKATDNDLILCTLKHNENKLMEATFYQKDIRMVPSRYYDATSKSDSRFDFNREINSIAVGNIYGKDEGLYLLAADKTRIFIFNIDEKLIIKDIVQFTDEFSNIVSVEVADINGNGTDEIFISNIIEKNSIASSYIYEFNGENFIPKKSKVNYLFRSYYSNGKNSILAQNYQDNEFSGLIGLYGYVDTDYKVISDIAGSLGGKVYGAGISYSGDYAYIDKAGLFSERYQNNIVAKSKEVFGDSNKHIFYSREKVVGSRANPAGGEMAMTEQYTVAYPIYQRIIEIDRNKFFLFENTPVGLSVSDIDKFKSSNFGIYLISLSGSQDMLDVYEYQKGLSYSPSLVEAAIGTVGGGEYIFILSNSTKSRYDSSTNCQLTIMQLIR